MDLIGLDCMSVCCASMCVQTDVWNLAFLNAQTMDSKKILKIIALYQEEIT